MIRKNGIIFFSMIMTVLLVFICSFSYASSDDPFEIKRIGNINPYADNVFMVRSDEDGVVTIRVHDSICTYRTITERISAGENRIHWDGCGYNEEKLYEKTYTITTELITDSGHLYQKSFNSPIEFPLQCLQYAMPSSEHLYLDAKKEWFIEYRTVTDGTVCIDFYPGEGNEASTTYSFPAYGGKIGRKDYASIAGKKELKPGIYSVDVYEKSIPEKKISFQVNITEQSPEKAPISVTGGIMPDRSMNDAEIWEMMMKPSVVVDIDYFQHQDVYSNPDEISESLGTLHGQTQGLEVIRIDGEWALVGAWNHEDASYVEGWVPVSKLKSEYPAKEYGILIDKQKQTLTVYRNGAVIDTLLVSSGRAEKNRLYQETSAGCFLTGYHRVNFSMNGKKYDYVIQYDGGNLLHQTPYDWGHQKKDFTMGRGYLGAKASHACIRIQPEPGPGGLNAFWLFTHLPYHTRIIILDDPEERTARTEKLSRAKEDSFDITKIHYADKQTILEDKEDKVKITFGGNVVPGGTKAANAQKSSFASYVRKNGYASAFEGIYDILSSDDLTAVNLGCMILPSEAGGQTAKGTKAAENGTEQIFSEGSVELVQMISDDVFNAGQKNYDDTVETVRSCSNVLERDKTFAIELKGHLFGFAGCSESEYLKNPGIIDQRITELREKQCEVIVMMANWGETNKTSEHTIVQEAMAHRGIRAGAGLVVGNQPGVILGADYMEGVPVFYSLGNLLDGSGNEKNRKQQGMLLQAEFSFETGEEPVTATMIPVLTSGKKNTYGPDADLGYSESEKIIRRFREDTADGFIDRIRFYLEDRS